jgi:hypothetical protein
VEEKGGMCEPVLLKVPPDEKVHSVHGNRHFVMFVTDGSGHIRNTPLITVAY